MDSDRDIRAKFKYSRYARTLRTLDNGDKIDAIIVDFSKAFDLVPHGRLLTKIANSGEDSKVVVWIREFVLGRTHGVSVGGQVSAEVRVMSGIPQGNLLCPLLSLAYVNFIWMYTESTIRLCADDCNLQTNCNNADMEKLQKKRDRLWDWAFEMR